MARGFRCKYHRYRRFINQNGKPQWKCMDCESYTYTGVALIGNLARCYNCNDEFKITPNKLIYAKIKCGQNKAECDEKLEERAEAAGLKAPSIQDLIKLAYVDDKDLDRLQREAVAKALGAVPESRSETEQEGDSLLSSMMKGDGQ